VTITEKQLVNLDLRMQEPGEEIGCVSLFCDWNGINVAQYNLTGLEPGDVTRIDLEETVDRAQQTR